MREAYAETFTQLREICLKSKVKEDILPNEDATIHLKSSPSNILQLQNNLSTDAFYQEQVKAILEAMPKDDDEKEKEVKQITLNTKTPHPLQTIADIDDYLSKLRTQLIKVIENGDSVMVIK